MQYWISPAVTTDADGFYLFISSFLFCFSARCRKSFSVRKLNLLPFKITFTFSKSLSYVYKPIICHKYLFYIVWNFVLLCCSDVQSKSLPKRWLLFYKWTFVWLLVHKGFQRKTLWDKWVIASKIIFMSMYSFCHYCGYMASSFGNISHSAQKFCCLLIIFHLILLRDFSHCWKTITTERNRKLFKGLSRTQTFSKD